MDKFFCCSSSINSVKKNLKVELTQSDYTPSWKQGEPHDHLQFTAHYTGAVVKNMES